MIDLDDSISVILSTTKYAHVVSRYPGCIFESKNYMELFEGNVPICKCVLRLDRYTIKNLFEDGAQYFKPFDMAKSLSEDVIIDEADGSYFVLIKSKSSNSNFLVKYTFPPNKKLGSLDEEFFKQWESTRTMILELSIEEKYVPHEMFKSYFTMRGLWQDNGWKILKQYPSPIFERFQRSLS